jgi:2-polyprenyl-6-methoxyphenol hydroxylase-like FAD-dependent oxidoreductase
MPRRNATRNAVVAGGSIGGLCAAVALRGIGCEVEVFERAPGVMTSRGAGIVVQDELVHLLQRYAGSVDLPSTACRQRRHLVPDGDDGVTVPMPQRFTSWDAVYRTLRRALPERHYHPGVTVAGFAQEAGRMIVRCAERGEIAADLLVCAEGSRSESRGRLLPGVEPAYAGYVAWRGAVEEQYLDAGLTRFFDGSFTLCQARSGGHILCYMIPGPGAATGLEGRRLNWVWYVASPAGHELERLLTDRNGKVHAASVPAGLVPDALTAEIRAAATGDLHPRFAELVGATLEPFVQVIADLVVPRMVFGHACLFGDAAFVVRPHPAAATAKAAADAVALGEALAAEPSDLDAALRAWELARLAAGRGLVEHGMALGTRTVVPAAAGIQRPAPTLSEAAERFGAVARLPERE